MSKLYLPAGSAATAPYEVAITPESAGWGYSSLKIVSLPVAGTEAFETEDDEVIIVPLSGGVSVESDGSHVDLDGRAGVFSGPLGSVHLQGRAIVVAVLAWGAAIAGFGLVLLAAGRTTPSTVLWGALAAALLFLVVAGAADGISAIFRQSVLLTATPDSMRGRLQGVFIVVVAGGPRLGDLVLGAQAAWFGEAVAALVGGLACVAVVLLLVRWQPRFLAYDARDPQP